LPMAENGGNGYAPARACRDDDDENRIQTLPAPLRIDKFFYRTKKMQLFS